MATRPAPPSPRRRHLLRTTWCVALLATRAAVAGNAGGAAPSAVLDVPLPPSQVQQAILQAVRAIPAHAEARRRYRMAVPFGAALFPPDADFAAPPASPGLAGWLALPRERRRHDVLVVPDVDYDWEAEGGRYSCQFILHVEPRAGGGTRLGLLQVRPTTHAGERFDLFGRTGPGRYLDLRPAAPSAQSAAALRAFLAAALAPGQQGQAQPE